MFLDIDRFCSGIVNARIVLSYIIGNIRIMVAIAGSLVVLQLDLDFNIVHRKATTRLLRQGAAPKAIDVLRISNGRKKKKSQ